MNFTLKLGPLYSKIADHNELASLNTSALDANSYILRKHQAEVWKAYNDKDVDVIFDTALTGDGKTLSGVFPMLAKDHQSLLLYPTNELIKDQQKQVERYMQAFGFSDPCQIMYSETITEEYEQRKQFNRASVALRWFKNRACILSNPDLFHLMGSYNYGNNHDKREFVYQIPENIHYIVFDEFHIFGVPQIISVLNILNYQKVIAPHQRLKYIFLSATPTPLFKTLLENSDFRIKVIEGSYTAAPTAGYTPEPIVQPVDLHFHSVGDRGAYGWAEEHLSELKAFFQNHPTAKGVFIVNSVATAKRLVTYYQKELADCIKVGENTGLTGKEERNNSMNDPEVKLIIATSTIDVGVDFEINLLIFESTNAGTFIQRLGRLGRHKHTDWQEYRAYALLPDWTIGRIAERFTDGTEIDRVEFLKAVQNATETVVAGQEDQTVKPIFPQEQDFRRYIACWGGLQVAQMIVNAEGWKVGKLGSNNSNKPDFSESAQRLRQQYNKVYKHSKNPDWIGTQVKRYYKMAKDEDEKLILDELTPFRGRSPLDCGIYDETDDHFKRYNLFFLLANTEFDPMAEAEFRQMVEARGEPFRKYQSHELKLYVRLHKYTEERENFHLTSTCKFEKNLNRIGIYDNFEIGDNRRLAYQLSNETNERLADLSLVSLVVAEHPKEFKKLHRLNMLFPIHQVKGEDNRSKPYSIIFGLSALLAHSLVFWKATKSDCDELLIF